MESKTSNLLFTKIESFRAHVYRKHSQGIKGAAYFGMLAKIINRKKVTKHIELETESHTSEIIRYFHGRLYRFRTQ